jgi:hypothetical protein
MRRATRQADESTGINARMAPTIGLAIEKIDRIEEREAGCHRLR